MEFLALRIGKFKLPRRIDFTEEPLPKTDERSVSCAARSGFGGGKRRGGRVKRFLVAGFWLLVTRSGVIGV